jgi:hypothetical protein
MVTNVYQLNSRNCDGDLDKFDTNKVYDKFIDYSASVNTKTDAQKSLSHSTEPQSRNLSRQVLKPILTER